MDISHEQQRLQRASMSDLRDRYAEMFGEATHTGNRLWLTRKILYRVQALAEGDLTERAKERAAELANDADLRVAPPTPKRAAPTPTPAPTPEPLPVPSDPRLPRAGTILTRDYKGQTIQVKILADGFEFRGVLYRSLSAVAKTITGSHCNGFAFFKLTGSHA
jgi:hypothetical protein